MREERPRARSRITEALRREVVRRYENGVSSRRIAAYLHISKASVLKILRIAGVELKSAGAHY